MNFKDMNDILKDASKRMKFKEITNEDDVILIIFKDELWWAVVTRIGDEDEVGIRDVYIKLLAIPPLEVHLHISSEQLDGLIPFMIDNHEAFIKAVNFKGSYIPEEIREIYRKNVDDDDNKDKVKVIGSNSIN